MQRYLAKLIELAEKRPPQVWRGGNLYFLRFATGEEVSLVVGDTIKAWRGTPFSEDRKTVVAVEGERLLAKLRGNYQCIVDLNWRAFSPIGNNKVRHSAGWECKAQGLERYDIRLTALSAPLYPASSPYVLPLAVETSEGVYFEWPDGWWWLIDVGFLGRLPALLAQGRIGNLLIYDRDLSKGVLLTDLMDYPALASSCSSCSLDFAPLPQSWQGALTYYYLLDDTRITIPSLEPFTLGKGLWLCEIPCRWGKI